MAVVKVAVLVELPVRKINKSAVVSLMPLLIPISIFHSKLGAAWSIEMACSKPPDELSKTLFQLNVLLNT